MKSMNTDFKHIINYPNSRKQVRIALLVGAIIAAFALSGCVSQKKYDAALQDIAKLTVDSTFQEYKFTDKTFEKDGVIFEQQKALEAKAAKLDSLQKVVASQDERLLLRMGFLNELRNSNWEATERDGQVIIQLRDDLVFQAGSSEVSSEGLQVLVSISKAVASVEESIEIWVVGHTDNQPFEGDSKDNWDLSSERSLTVVRQLIQNKIDPALITSSAKSKYDPRAPNLNGLTRQLNRRTEIIIVPIESPYATIKRLVSPK